MGGVFLSNVPVGAYIVYKSIYPLVIYQLDMMAVKLVVIEWGNKSVLSQLYVDI